MYQTRPNFPIALAKARQGSNTSSNPVGALRKEIAATLAELRTFERYVVGLIGVIVVSLATHPKEIKSDSWVWWIPSVVVALGAFRELALYRSLGIAARYLRKREKGFFLKQGVDLDWEETKAREVAGVVVWTAIFWFALLAFAVAAAVRHP